MLIFLLKYSINKHNLYHITCIALQIALVPRIESVPFFRDSAPNEIRRQEYERYRCGQAFYSVVKGNIPDLCKKYHYSIGFYVHGGAFCKYCSRELSL
jgi:coxsackievirus/adenovirus receptor